MPAGIEHRLKQLYPLFEEMKDEVFRAESEAVWPLDLAWDHARHALSDLFDAASAADVAKQDQLLNEIEGHLLSMGVYAWQELAARELVETKEQLNESGIRGRRRAIEIHKVAGAHFEHAKQRYTSGRLKSRKDHDEAIKMFQESIKYSREARDKIEPLTTVDTVLVFATIGSLAVAIIETILLFLR
jgi:hypothetical protein